MVTRLDINDKRVWSWWGIYFTLIVVILLLGSIPFSNFKHTWQEPANDPGKLLKSEHWNRDFWFTITLILAVLIPFTAAHAMGYPSNHRILNLHIGLCIFFFIYYTVIIIIWSIDFANRNAVVASNARNPFNDDRWCLLNYGLSGADCTNLVGPMVAVSPVLVVNSAMAYKFFMLVIFTAWLIVDFAWSISFKMAMTAYLDAKQQQTIVYSTPAKEMEDVETPMLQRQLVSKRFYNTRV